MTNSTVRTEKPKMELLAPAGGMKHLEAALRFGADAVYGGLAAYSLRASAANFTWEELGEAVARTHERGAKFYLTLNLLPFDEDLYYDELMKRVATSRRKEGGTAVFADTASSFAGTK